MASEGADIYLRFIDESGKKPPKWGDRALQGECMDERHQGADGWIQIREFSFSFGAGDKADAFESRVPTTKATTPEELAKQNQALLAERKALKAANRPKEKVSWGKSGPLDFEKFSFTKGADCLSAILVEIAHGGSYKIPQVLVEAVRYGGTGEDFKIPFLQLIFENVYIKSSKLNLVSDELPTEDIEFEYDVVRMVTIWTDNATGNRLPQQPVRAGWNLPDQKEAVQAQ